MDNRMWSTYVQTPEELDASRALRFREDNAEMWLSAMKLRDVTDILELGSGGGLFTRRIKAALPGARVTGLDRDAGHIEHARRRAEEAGLDITYVLGDALALPFAENSFDATTSYTVCEHIETQGFLREQYRVLRLGGSIAVLCVQPSLNLGGNMPWAEEGEEKALMDAAWANIGDFDKRNGVCAYPLTPREMPMALEQAGFTRVSLDIFAVMAYAPDSADVPEKRALEQIGEERLSILSSMRKALSHPPRALTTAQEERLEALINARFDARIERYQRGEKLWDVKSSTVLCATGYKATA